MMKFENLKYNEKNGMAKTSLTDSSIDQRLVFDLLL